MHFILTAVIILINLCGHGVWSAQRPGPIHVENPVGLAHNARQEPSGLGPYVRPNHQPLPANSTKGRTFDRFVQIWLWNQDYKSAAKDRKYTLLRAHASNDQNADILQHHSSGWQNKESL
jgi:hypothetical protein